MIDFLKDITLEAGKVASSYFLKEIDISYKSSSLDLLTEADIATSDFLIKKIKEKYPNHSILTEEHNEFYIEGETWQWVIDPIDGTRNFAKGIPIWAVMIAILKDKQLIYSSVYFPTIDKLFYAAKNQGAFCNKQQLKPKLYGDFANLCCLASCYPNIIASAKHQKEFSIAMNSIFKHPSLKYQTLGAGASMVLIADGSFDFGFKNAGYDWDNLPIALILREAGFLVLNLKGQDWQQGQSDFIVCPSVFKYQILDFFRN